MSKKRQHVATTEEVLFAYQGEGDGGFAFNPDHSEEGFYAWLNEVKASAWNEGFRMGFAKGIVGDYDKRDNPHLEEEEK